MAAHGIDAAAAVAHLAKADRRLAGLIERIGPFALELKPLRSVFAALAEAIVYQQLSTKEAATIFGRLCSHFPRGAAGLTAERLLALPEDALRGAGLSQAKARSVRDLAARTLRGEIPTVAAVRRLDDAAIVERLTAVHGIGRWSAEMFLMFHLGRPDVLPLGDYSLRKAHGQVFDLGDVATPRQLERQGEAWRPYRTVASWYLWQSLAR